ncbi:MAG: hypothetical protein AB7V27_16555 [Candidatus Binatia bacterium]
MGLKNIHLVFISLAIALCVGFGSWCVWRYGDQGTWPYLAVALVSFGAAGGLMAYGSWFINKMKGTMHDS